MPGVDRIHGDHVTLRPTEEADRTALKAIRDEPEVVRWWGEETASWHDELLMELVVEPRTG